MGSDSRGLSRIDLPAGGAHMLNQTAGKTLGGCSGGPPLRWGTGRVSASRPGRTPRPSAGSPATDAGIVNYVMMEMARTSG
jgi:hypothetical protein